MGWAANISGHESNFLISTSGAAIHIVVNTIAIKYIATGARFTWAAALNALFSSSVNASWHYGRKP